MNNGKNSMTWYERKNVDRKTHLEKMRKQEKCQCGRTISHGKRARHLLSKRHQLFMKK